MRTTRTSRTARGVPWQQASGGGARLHASHTHGHGMFGHDAGLACAYKLYLCDYRRRSGGTLRCQATAVSPSRATNSPCTTEAFGKRWWLNSCGLSDHCDTLRFREERLVRCGLRPRPRYAQAGRLWRGWAGAGAIAVAISCRAMMKLLEGTARSPPSAFRSPQPAPVATAPQLRRLPASLGEQQLFKPRSLAPSFH